ncbi:Pr6Pr family membrane protein [Algicella marina]|uniref:Pr6Pr family membrane protein n=1 Tax=Algicella marina TaxID=2683284 RepID=A0A6P1T5S8_9RHOB|nr:Pr6Pr family membrane protein [Algicella marina]QHQ37053.1 hypothetical protein GO499_18640 [Algicella marina]
MKWQRIAFAVVGLAAAVTVLVQYDINVERRGGYWPAAVSFFGYFTIWTNILVACVCLWLARMGAWRDVHVSLASATTMFILFVGGVYHALLAADHNPRGLAAVTNLFLHYLIPAGMLTLWLVFVPKGRLGWGAALAWIVFPAVYLCFALVRGEVIGRYPYFFINVADYGYRQVLINAAGFTALLLVLGLGFVVVDRLLARGSRTVA